jgi:hypothetical protein
VNCEVEETLQPNKRDISVQSPPQIFINQSNNVYILAKYGQTVSLPCVVFSQKNKDFSNVSQQNLFFVRINCVI